MVVYSACIMQCYVFVLIIDFVFVQLSAWIQHKQDIEVFLAEELLPSLLQLSR